MSHENDEDKCEAFGQIFNTINVLKRIENNIKYQHTSALEKCKREIENLLSVAVNHREREENSVKVS